MKNEGMRTYEKKIEKKKKKKKEYMHESACD